MRTGKLHANGAVQGHGKGFVRLYEYGSASTEVIFAGGFEVGWGAREEKKDLEGRGGLGLRRKRR